MLPCFNYGVYKGVSMWHLPISSLSLNFSVYFRQGGEEERGLNTWILAHYWPFNWEIQLTSRLTLAVTSKTDAGVQTKNRGIGINCETHRPSVNEIDSVFISIFTFTFTFFIMFIFVCSITFCLSPDLHFTLQYYLTVEIITFFAQ